MIYIRLLPVLFSIILLSAHFLRFHGLTIALLVLSPTLLLPFRWRWIIRLWQVWLFCGTLIWIETTINLIQSRIALQLSWSRLALIMTAVILFTVFSGFWLENRKIKEKFVRKKL